jgi:hypothetical protein
LLSHRKIDFLFVWRFILVAFALTLITSVHAQNKSSRKDSIRNEKIRQGKLLFSQVVIPASAPETGFLIGSVSAFTFSLDPTDSTLQRSSVPLIGYASVRGAFGLQIDAVLFFKKKIRVLNYLEFNHITDHYWGVGYEAGSTVKQGESTTQYEKNNFQWSPKILKEIRPKIFLGAQINYTLTLLNEPNPLMQQDDGYLKYGDEVSVFGAGALMQYDTRDMIVNAWKGTLIELSWLSYPAQWTTGDGYSVFNFDYRKFIGLGSKPGKILALNFRTRLTVGDTPYTELSTIGSDNNLRAYYGGRYRDQHAAFALAEYRHTFSKKGGLSKHGAVIWAGAGEVWNQTIEIENILPVVGLGYRFALQPRINLRVDVGFGRDSFGFYMNITEAF